MELVDIKSMYLMELQEFLISLKQPKFRAKQIFDWLHVKKAVHFEEMTNLPKSLTEQLNQHCYITTLAIDKKLESQIDGTIKFLYKLNDGEYVESVVMRYEHGNSICVSTQVGCKMGCVFCASTKAGFVRNLTASEILEQIYEAGKNIGERISNVVLMGIGEPFDNYDNVVRFLRLVSDPDGHNMSLRHLSLSTCGVVDKIYDLAELELGLTLSISLHASNDEIRSETMPINSKWGISELLQACRVYVEKTGRRISFEYALIKGVNDTKANADELAKILKGMLCHVNLIPVNEIEETDFKKTDKRNVFAFQQMLNEKGINTTVRRTLGSDISAACGQLRREQNGWIQDES